MKRDMELIRELMLSIELKDDSDYAAEELEIIGERDISEIKYHLQLLVDAEFIKAEVGHYNGNDSPVIVIDRMLWNGHEFLANAYNESVWKKAKAIVAEKGGTVSAGVLMQLLASIAKQQFGLS